MIIDYFVIAFRYATRQSLAFHSISHSNSWKCIESDFDGNSHSKLLQYISNGKSGRKHSWQELTKQGLHNQEPLEIHSKKNRSKCILAMIDGSRPTHIYFYIRDKHQLFNFHRKIVEKRFPIGISQRYYSNLMKPLLKINYILRGKGDNCC